ncbi:MAG: KH domain-containing protein [Syntrophaceae bacterium]|nr:KH domain-containing protein [Syntrophaceae bacterium]
MEEIEIAKELTTGLLNRMGLKPEVEALYKEGTLNIEIKGDHEGILIGKYGRTLESLQILINKMVNKKLKTSIKIIIDIDNYRERRSANIIRMAQRLGEKAKRTSHSITIGPFNAHDRRIIHLALKEDPSLKTESLGNGDLKEIRIIPINQKG